MYKLIAHRGEKKSSEENSLAAFFDAINGEYVGFECDVRMTKDKKFVIYHDALFKGKLVKTLDYEVFQKENISPGLIIILFILLQASIIFVILFSCSLKSTPCNFLINIELCPFTILGNSPLYFVLEIFSLLIISLIFLNNISFFIDIL